MREKADLLIEEILHNYSDFQVRTIDSFMATVFKTSAIDFGYNPEFDILMSIDTLMEYSFDYFLRDVREGTAQARLFEDIIRIILDQKGEHSAYPWDPSKILLEEVKKIYRKLASTGSKIMAEDLSSGMFLSFLQEGWWVNPLPEGSSFSSRLARFSTDRAFSMVLVTVMRRWFFPERTSFEMSNENGSQTRLPADRPLTSTSATTPTWPHSNTSLLPA
jgi:hypothetical protein